MIQIQMVVILVNFLRMTPAKYIYASAAVVVEIVVVVAARKTKLSSQNLTEAGRIFKGPFLPGRYRF
jgi:hypothetical protein